MCVSIINLNSNFFFVLRMSFSNHETGIEKKTSVGLKEKIVQSNKKENEKVFRKKNCVKN